LREGANPHLISVLHAARDPAGTAVAWGRVKRSWEELRDRIERLMRLLIEEGVGPGHGVALALPNRPEFVEAAVAALAVGADVFPLNPRLPAAEMDRQLAALEPGLTVTTVRRKSIPGRVLHPGAELEDALERAPESRPPIGRLPLGRIVLFTSGTEGRPKGAVHPLANNASLAASAGLLRVLPLRAGDVTLVACPLYHAAASASP